MSASPSGGWATRVQTLETLLATAAPTTKTKGGSGAVLARSAATVPWSAPGGAARRCRTVAAVLAALGDAAAVAAPARRSRPEVRPPPACALCRERERHRERLLPHRGEGGWR